MLPLRLQLGGYGISSDHTKVHVHLPVSGSEEARKVTVGVNRVSVHIPSIIENARMMRYSLSKSTMSVF